MHEEFNDEISVDRKCGAAHGLAINESLFGLGLPQSLA